MILIRKSFAAYAGPGWLMSLAYLDPGNLESDLQSGAFTGYSLLWVLLLCSLVQSSDLIAELAIIGADIQEVVGTGIALRVLFGWPLWVGSLATGADTFTFLLIHYLGKRFLEAFIFILIMVLMICYCMNFFFMPPSPGPFFHGFLFECHDYAVLQLVGTVGAVIMPHNLYLHSGICKERACNRSDHEHVKQANKYSAIDSAVALAISFLINTALVSTFAAGFFSLTCAKLEDGPLACLPPSSDSDSESISCITGTGSRGVCSDIGLTDAGETLKRLFGGHGEIGRTLFALGLLAAGQASTMTGTMAGQYVMEGFLEWRIPLWLRTLITRLISLGPAVAIAVYTSSSPNLNNKVDQWINVLQSVQLPFALLPVLHFNSDAQLMGKFRLTRIFRFICWMLALVVIVTNIYLVAQYAQSDETWIRVAVTVFFLVYAILITAGPMLTHLSFIGFAIWGLFRNTVLKHLLLKVEIWPERMSTIQKCLLGLEKHKRKAFFDEDEEGFWLDTGNLSKQDKAASQPHDIRLHRYMDTDHRIHPGDMAAAVKEALVRCRSARRKRAVRLEQLDREFREQKAMGRNGCLSRIIRWQKVLSVSLYGADRQSELQERESSCPDPSNDATASSYLTWASNDRRLLLETDAGNIMLRLRPDSAPLTVEHVCRVVDAGLYDGCYFYRGAFGFRMKQRPGKQEVFAEVADASSYAIVRELAAAVKKEEKPASVVTEGVQEKLLGESPMKTARGRTLKSLENLFACLGRKDRRPRRVRGLPKKALHMEMERTQEFLPEEFFDALIPVWQEKLMLLAFVGFEITEGQGPHLSPRECHYWPETTLSQRPRRVRLQGVEEPQNSVFFRPVRSSVEEGRTMHGSSLRLEALLGREQPPADREASGPLESFLLRAHSGCRIDLPTLITAHDELLTENLELRKQNEALQTQVAGMRNRSPKKLPHNLVSPSSRAQVAQLYSEHEEIQEDGIPTAPSSWREVDPGSPSIVNVAAAAFAAVKNVLSNPNTPSRRPGRSASVVESLEEGVVVQPTSPTHLFSRPTSRAPSQRSSPQRKTQGRLLLPIPSAAERAQPWSQGNSPSKSPGSASPWRNAMRPVRNKEWSDAQGSRNPMPQHVPFEFSGAVRPTDPGAWPQEKMNPIMEALVTAVLIKTPDDPAEFMMKWLLEQDKFDQVEKLKAEKAELEEAVKGA
eukprot:s2156_g9.t2